MLGECENTKLMIIIYCVFQKWVLSAVNRSTFPTESLAHDIFWCLDFQFAMIEKDRVPLFDYQKILNWVDLTCKNKTDFVLIHECFRFTSGDTFQRFFWWQLFWWQVFWRQSSWNICRQSMSRKSSNWNDKQLSQKDDFHFGFEWLKIDTNEMYQFDL